MSDSSPREEAVFEAALALPTEQRAAYLDRACGDQPDLRRRVEALLDAHERAGNFLAEPAVTVAANRAAFSAAPAEKSGDKIGRYKLLQQIGEGGCGVVYMAEQEEPVRRRVALKIIKLGMDTKQVVARFEAERQALALMDHPNIARVFDAGATESGRPFFVMELVRGIKITEYCDQNNLSTEERLKLFVEICRAVQHAHQKGVIHRDIKPSNILVTVNDGVPVPKVIDFGIAKATQGRLTDQTLFTAFEQFIGTPAYMSPEQAAMTSLDIDTRSDIYSLGVLLYELLTGQTPLDAKKLLAAGLEEMRRTIREREPLRPSTRLSTMTELDLTTTARRRRADPPRLIHLVRGDLDWIVMKCLEKDRTRRYETANGLAADVQHHLNNEPVVARPPSKLYEFQKTVQRHKFGFVACAVVITVLAAGVIVSTREAIRATRAEREQIRLRQQADEARSNEVKLRSKAEAGEQKANTEAAKSQQVARFLEDMLQGVGPSVALGRDTTMLKEILDKTADRVGKDLTNQPLVEVELRNTIGCVYLELGQYQKAEAMQREALAIARKVSGNEPLRITRSLFDLADVLRREGRYAEAEILLREALTIIRKPPDDEDRADVLNLLADVLRYEGKLDEAEPMQRQALAMRRKLFGNEDREVGISLNNLALVFEAQGKFAKAETTLREALTVFRKVFGDENPETAITLDNLARVLLAEERFTEAESVSRETLAIRRKLLSNDHPMMAESLSRLASVLIEEGKLSEAEALFRESLAIGERIGNSRSPAWSLQMLAKVLAPEGRSAEAEAAIHRAVAIEKQFNDNNLHAWNLRTLGLVLAYEGKLAEAEAVYREDLQFVKSTFDEAHSSFSAVLTDLADTLYQQDRFAEAETAYRQALAARKSKSGNEMRIAESLNNLATTLHAEGKLDEAEPLAREGLAICEKQIPNNRNWRTFDARRLLGGILVGQKKYIEAEPLLRSGYEGMKQQFDKIPLYCNPRLKGSLQKQALQRMVQLYEATHRPDQAAEWKQKQADFDKIEAEKKVSASQGQSAAASKESP